MANDLNERRYVWPSHKRSIKIARFWTNHSPSDPTARHRFLQGIAFVLLATLCSHEQLIADSSWTATGGVTATFQTASDTRVRSELHSSADLVIGKRFGKGDFRLYLEGNATGRSNGISALLPEANTDVGSALDKNEKGRVQVSELAYHHVFSDRHELTLGLIDVTGYFDQSRIASDENAQFLGVSFVQNPTIDFPDYTLGAVYEHSPDSDFVIRVGLTSSKGLADNPSLSYAQLLDVDDSNKGVFVISSAAYARPRWHVRLGAWTHTAPHPGLDGVRDDLKKYGVYTVGGYRTVIGAVNVRLGLANMAVSRAAGFAAVSYQYKADPLVCGIGLGRTFLSKNVPEPAVKNLSHVETYLRWDVSQNFIATADVQHLIHPNFDRSATVVDANVTVYGVRFTFLFG